MSAGEPRGTSRRPLVGMSTYLERAQSGVWDVPACFLPRTYLDGLTHAGGIAVLLPPQPVDADILDAVLAGLHGLVLTGGSDLDPARYGQPPHPETDQPRHDRDGWELALVRGALRRDMPVLAICRGVQVLNVALGGSLYQHLPDVVGHQDHRRALGTFATLAVQTVSGTRLAGLAGPEALVECHHHQAIAELGHGLRVAARTADGVIEAVEQPGDSFVVGVQWHPEERRDDSGLFAGLVAAARRAAMSGDDDQGR